MKKRLLYAALAAGLLAGLLAIFSLSASAQQRTFLVRLPTGSIIKVTVDATSTVLTTSRNSRSTWTDRSRGFTSE